MLQKNVWTLLLLSTIHLAVSGQAANSFLHPDYTYDQLSVRQNIPYHATPVKGIHNKFHLFDWYEGQTDKRQLRPLVIMMHGGGFKLGSKSTDSTPFIARAFAQMGYPCASINYRRSKKRPLARFEDLAEGCFDALEDLQLAIRFFKQHWQEYRIDTNRIILAGNSAGGMMALHAVYSSRFELGQFIKKENSHLLDKSHNPENIFAVINFWGAIYDTSWLKNSRVPIMTIHGGKDRVVPHADKKGPIFGSGIIYRNAVRLGINCQMQVFEKSGHELHRHFNPLGAGSKARKRWQEAAVRTGIFLNTLQKAAP